MSDSQCHKGLHVCFTVSKGISCFIVSKGIFWLFHNVKKESPDCFYRQPLWHHVLAIRLWKFVHFQIPWFIIKRNKICEYLSTDIRSWIWPLLLLMLSVRACVRACVCVCMCVCVCVCVCVKRTITPANHSTVHAFHHGKRLLSQQRKHGPYFPLSMQVFHIQNNVVTHTIGKRGLRSIVWHKAINTFF